MICSSMQDGRVVYRPSESVICRFRDEKGFRCVPSESSMEPNVTFFRPVPGWNSQCRDHPRLKCKAVAGGANNQFAAGGCGTPEQKGNPLRS